MPQLPDGLDVTKVPRSVPRANLRERAEAENARFSSLADQARREIERQRDIEVRARALVIEREMAGKGKEPVYFKGSPQAPA